MPRTFGERLQPPKETLTPIEIFMRDFRLGLVTFTDDVRTPRNAVRVASNVMQTFDDVFMPRYGQTWYGTALPGGRTIVDAGVYETSARVRHIVVIANDGTSWRSTDDGQSWTQLTGITFNTSATDYCFLQGKSFLYIANSYDELVRYNGTTTLQLYTPLAQPAAPSLTKTGMAGTNYNIYYRIVAVNEIGMSQASNEATTTMGKQRANWTVGTDYIDLDWADVAGATRYDIYISDETNQEVFLDSVSTSAYRDTGEVSPNFFQLYPTDNTSTGIKFGQMDISGNKMWATKNRQTGKEYDVYWSGSGDDFASFSVSYGGGYVALEKGGIERPECVINARDGKGGIYATVLTSNSNGTGSLWQIALEDVTIADTTITIPVPVKVLAKTGTASWKTVTNYKETIYALNLKGYYASGAKPNLLNLLDTDEVTVNVRQDFRRIKANNAILACAIEHDDRILVSIPVGDVSANNKTYVFNPQKRTCQGEWDFGVKKFVQYTDNTQSIQNLLAVGFGQTRLIRLGEDVRGDFGLPFQCDIQSGLIPVTKSSFDYALIDRAYIGIPSSSGAGMSFEVSGSTRNRGFSRLKAKPIGVVESGTSTGNYMWGEPLWGEPVGEVSLFAQVDQKYYMTINKYLESVRFRFTSYSTSAFFHLNFFRATGFLVPLTPPQRQRL